MNGARGIDVSAAQAPAGIDWAKVRAAGFEFAYLRQGYGAHMDGAFVAHHDRARGADVALGAYQFSMVDADPSDDVRAFLEACKPLDFACPPMLDLETRNGASGDATLAWARAWIERLRDATGADPLIYTGAAFWRSLGPGSLDPFWAGVRLAVAQYGVVAPTVPSPFKGWALWQRAGNTIWQQSGTGRQAWGKDPPHLTEGGAPWYRVASSVPVPGVTGEVDVDELPGPLADLLAPHRLDASAEFGDASRKGLDE